MTRVVFDDTMRAKLNHLAECVEVCDEAGRVLGYFHPVLIQDRSLYAEVQSPFTEEELDRRSQEPGGHTLAEIWARMPASSMS